VIIRRSTELRINLGNYEHAILRAEVEVDDAEFGPVSTQLAIDTVQAILDKSLAIDVEEVRECSALTKDESFIFHWKTTEE
jgi:hypothetical protein